MESYESKDINEVGVYKEITNRFGVYMVRLGYKPENMKLERYTLDEEQEKAYLFYEYNGETIRYSIYMNETDSSFAQKELDKMLDEYEINNNGIEINIKEFLIDDTNRRYIAEFKYKQVQYQLKGVMDRDEFDNIIRNLIFL